MLWAEPEAQQSTISVFSATPPGAGATLIHEDDSRNEAGPCMSGTGRVAYGLSPRPAVFTGVLPAAIRAQGIYCLAAVQYGWLCLVVIVPVSFYVYKWGKAFRVWSATFDRTREVITARWGVFFPLLVREAFTSRR